MTHPVGTVVPAPNVPGKVGDQVVRRRIGWARGEQLTLTTAGVRVVKL